MAYKKRYQKSKCLVTQAGAKSVAMKALNGVKYLKGIINSELKTNGLGASVTPSSSGSIIHVTAITEGDTEQQRNGNSIFAKSLRAHFNLICNGSATATMLRIILFWDNQQIEDTSPIVADVLESTDPLSHINHASYGRFKVLYDRNFTLDNVTNKQRLVNVNRYFAHHVKW
ncbi:hypothetical protein, partial [Shewanella sp.]|uniref:hypothetical protein n=1 Tax=Shewanella sp. TaxID=50422 RepID=UPI0040483B44